MESIKVLIDGVEKEVYGLLYVYNLKYYFIYTEKEIDENGYVVLYMIQVGKETQNTANGPVDTGFMVGVEISDPEEQKQVQNSISIIVEDKKNGTINPQINYLPMSMITKLKIVSKKRFRLLKSVMENNFKLTFEDKNTENDIVKQNNSHPNELQPLANIEEVLSKENNVENKASEEAIPNPDIFNNIVPEGVIPLQKNDPISQDNVPSAGNNVIIDYRAKYFEEEEKNKELEIQIEQLTQKLEDIKKILE